MALIKCRNCGKEISDRAPDCIHCGALIIKSEKNDILQGEIFKIKNEKQILEAENADFKNQIKEKEAEKDFLVQENSELKNQVHASAKVISSLEQNESSLTQQNTLLKNQIEDSAKAISSLEQKENSLVHQNAELKKKLSESQKSVATLERKIKKEKKTVSFKLTAKKALRIFLLIIRLLIMGFCLIGTAVCVFSDKIGIAIWFLINAIAVAPYLYQIIWNKISLPLSLKIAVEIITPIIASASIIIFYGGE